MKRNPIAVIQPTLPTSDPQWRNSGRVISRHRTVEAAEDAIDRANAKLRRQPGQFASWYDWHIVRVDTDGTRGPLNANENICTGCWEPKHSCECN